MTDLQAANRVVGNRVAKVNYRGKLNGYKKTGADKKSRGLWLLQRTNLIYHSLDILPLLDMRRIRDLTT